MGGEWEELFCKLVSCDGCGEPCRRPQTVAWLIIVDWWCGRPNLGHNLPVL